MTGKVRRLPTRPVHPTMEDLAVDENSLNLIHQAWLPMSRLEREVFNNFLIGALSASLPADEVEAAIRIANSCMEREVRRG